MIVLSLSPLQHTYVNTGGQAGVNKSGKPCRPH